VSRASYTTDPIEAAEDDIAGSKDLIASVADEIIQHQRWLENYRVAEKERARRLKRQELMYQLELRRRRTVRSLRRFSLASLRLARRVASFLVRNGTALVVALGQLLVRCAAWTAPRARTLALTLWRWSVAALAWTWLMAQVLARALVRAAHAFVGGASIGFSWMAAQYRSLDLAVGRSLAAGWSWTSRKTHVFTRAFLRAASISFSWIALKSKAGAVALGKWISAAFSWIRVEASVLARASLKGASISSAWIALAASVLSSKLSTQAKHGADALKRSALRARRSSVAWISTAGLRMETWRKRSPIAPHGEDGGNGLAPELAAPQSEPGPLPNEVSAAQHGTALICLEPLRARLPVVRAS
jgi:hypothetical protein